MDRTTTAVKRQISIMHCDLFDVGVRHQTTGKMLNRTWTPTQLLAHLSWLKHANARDHDIYVRPASQATPHGLVLLDDLTPENTAQMTLDGFIPAVLLETSPANYQAWVRFVPHPDDRTRGQLARLLARTYHADINSADSRHYGRLAGFTNRKKQHRRLCHPFWVLLRRSPGTATPLTVGLLREAEALCRHERKATTPTSPPQSSTQTGRAIYARALVDIHSRYGSSTDWSRADWVAARRLARAGFGQACIAQLILELSPSLSARKRGHQTSYATRTALKACLQTVH